MAADRRLARSDAGQGPSGVLRTERKAGFRRNAIPLATPSDSCICPIWGREVNCRVTTREGGEPTVPRPTPTCNQPVIREFREQTSRCLGPSLDIEKQMGVMILALIRSNNARNPPIRSGFPRTFHEFPATSQEKDRIQQISAAFPATENQSIESSCVSRSESARFLPDGSLGRFRNSYGVTPQTC